MDDNVRITLAYVELTHWYADSVDRGDGEAVAALFGPVGSWDGREFGLTVATGHDELVEHFSTSEPTGSVHLVSNHLVVDHSSSWPRATSTGHAIIKRNDRVRQVIVRYEDVLVEHGGAWKFADRTLRRAVSF